MELQTRTRVNHSFRNVKFNGIRVKDMSDAMIKRLAVYNSRQSMRPIWEKDRLVRVPDRVEVAARKELRLRGYKVIGLRIETIH